MKVLSIYVSEGHVSISVQNGVTRQVSGPTLDEVLVNMAQRDLPVLQLFCKAVLGEANGGSNARNLSRLANNQ